jgi:hypothetical protein
LKNIQGKREYVNNKKTTKEPKGDFFYPVPGFIYWMHNIRFGYLKVERV